MRHDRGLRWAAALATVLLCAGGEARGTCDPGTELLISEFMAQNATTIADEDGDYSDWIEIYDPCQPVVSLDGWYLTDDPDNLTKWRFPAVQLARGGTLLVFASGKNRAVAGSPLHTSFKLGAEGEYLALVKPDGTTVAQEFAPEFPPQYVDISYGFTQAASTPVAAGAPAAYHVPTAGDAASGTAWTQAGFDASSWASGPTGLGYADTGTGAFEVTYYKANVQVPDLATAEAVAADPALQASVLVAHPSTINYLNTGSGAHFGGDVPFPGQQIGTDVNDFVVVATGSIAIPAAGPWTFGVNSDDGFELELTRAPHVFSSSFPSPRGPGDTLATFSIPEAGAYDVRLIFYERGGGAELELFAAPGSHASFDGSFDLVGDTTAGGLALTGLAGRVATDVRAVMQGINASLWTRTEFELSDPSSIELLTLRAAYEDGFVAYLNGTEIARRNAPASPSWDAVATADRPLGDAGTFEAIDVSADVSQLVLGTNVLAIHGLNDAPADGAFLILPELRAVGTTVTTSPRYFAAPTPSTPNGVGFPAVSGTPAFSSANGLFTDPFSLTLSAAAPGAVIRYTTDGSAPTETHGTVYTGAIAVSDSLRMRARVFEAGLAPGPVITRFYVKLGADTVGFNSNLPIVVVDTFGAGLTQDFLAETLTGIIPTDGGRATMTGDATFAGPAGLKIRGSSSTSFPKKQFALEVWDDIRDDLHVSLLGMPSQSDWILYAPYTDKTLMRDFLAYKWSNDIGRYAVRTRYVEVFLRTAPGAVSASDYAGVYILQEKIKQDPNRVSLVDLQPEDALPPAVTGGYIIKKDRLDPGDTGFLVTSGQRLCYVEPKEEEITAAQAAYLTGYLNQMESALNGPGFTDPVTGYAAYLDAASFIDHHIMVEMTKNIDGYRLSTFFFKDRNGKLNAGPIWDYNLTLGNANYLEGWLASGWYYTQLGGGDYPWWPRLSQDAEYRMRYADRWYELRRGPLATSRLLGDIDATAALLNESQARNYVRWPILGTYVWPNWYIGATYTDEVAWMRQWLADRLAWIDSQFPAPPAFSHAGGEVPAGLNVSITASAGTIYYTLDGSDPRLTGGAVSPAALTYSGPLVIEQQTVVRTRALNSGVWSAINQATFSPVPPVYVNEVLPVNAGVAADDHGDFDPWIELYNATTSTVDLSGLSLSDDPALPHKWTFPAGTTLCGRSRLLVWADAEASEGPLHASFRPPVGGGTIRLYDGPGALLDSLTYPALTSNVSFGRHPDGSSNLGSFLYPSPGAANQPGSAAIVVNEYNGALPTRLLAGNGTDTYWGRILGNGGDWFELVVVKDHLDLRGWKVVVNDNAGAIVTTLTFTQASLLSNLRSGTILTVAADLATDVSFAPGAGDWWMNFRSGTAGDGLYISNLSFSVSQNNTQITVKDASGAVVFGPAGEGIAPASGVGNDEVWKLEENPGPQTTAFSNYHDGTSSSFGSPNIWNGGLSVQDLGALRQPVAGACATDGDCADANPCTDNTCVAGHCQDAPNAAPCDDGQACTTGDACSNYVCVGQQDPACCAADCDCDDGLVCTTDACVSGACVHASAVAAVVCSDGDACTVDSCSAGQCAHGGICAISGWVRYYRDDASDLEPSSKPVPSVGIDVDLDAAADATTFTDGAFAVSDLSGDLSITPLAKYGNPRASDANNGISSLDASVIGRAAASLLTLSPNQSLAADVTGDGTISALDASYVGRYAAGVVDHVPVATATGSDWLFLRCDAYAYPGPSGCVPPVHLFTPIGGIEANLGFYAILYGDVTGNWLPASGDGPPAP